MLVLFYGVRQVDCAVNEEYARKGVSENVNGGANARVGECPPDGKEFASRDSAGVVFEILASVRGIAWRKKIETPKWADLAERQERKRRARRARRGTRRAAAR